MGPEVLNQNELKARAESQRVLEESTQAWSSLNRETQDNNLTPEERTQARETKKELDWLMMKRDIVSINEILRNPAKKRLLSPVDLKKAFQMLRSIHMEETKQHVDTANVGAMRDDVTNRLDTVSQGYNEIFKNLQGHIENTGPIHEESGENLVDLQNEVTQAETSINMLLRKINSLGNTPTPLQPSIQDMPAEKLPDNNTSNNI